MCAVGVSSNDTPTSITAGFTVLIATRLEAQPGTPAQADARCVALCARPECGGTGSDRQSAPCAGWGVSEAHGALAEAIPIGSPTLQLVRGAGSSIWCVRAMRANMRCTAAAALAGLMDAAVAQRPVLFFGFFLAKITSQEKS